MKECLNDLKMENVPEMIREEEAKKITPVFCQIVLGDDADKDDVKIKCNSGIYESNIMADYRSFSMCYGEDAIANILLLTLVGDKYPV